MYYTKYRIDIESNIFYTASRDLYATNLKYGKKSTKIKIHHTYFFYIQSYKNINLQYDSYIKCATEIITRFFKHVFEDYVQFVVDNGKRTFYYLRP